LRPALDQLRDEDVDQVVVLGDLFELGERIEETCCLLSDAGAVGVWGNHDFGLCGDPDERTQEKYPDSVLDYMASLRPRLEVDGCLFTHVEPWLDPDDISDLWYFDGPPDTSEKAAKSFEAVPHRFMFVGHLHRWLIATPDAILGWAGENPIRLHGDTRYLILVAAVCDGKSSIFDTDTLELFPFG
jgi:hypothetical protein